MTLRSGLYRDPERIVEEKETKVVRSCAGCIHLRLSNDPFTRRQVLVCDLGFKVGQRCKLYEGRNQ